MRRKSPGVAQLTAWLRKSQQVAPSEWRREIVMNVLTVADRVAASRPEARRMPQLSFPVRLQHLLALVRRRGEEQRISMLLEELGHPGLIADFRRASRG
jgi:hypothetical protein